MVLGEMTMIYGIVVAGGNGTRIGYRKQYADLFGKPVWQRSVEALRMGGVDLCWLVVPSEDAAVVQQRVRGSDCRDCVFVAIGGATRFESVKNGLSAIVEYSKKSSKAPSHVAVHDAARPFVSPVDVRSVIAAAVKTGGAILASPCSDTVKQTTGGYIESTIPRESVWLAQTPQVFAFHWMQSKYYEPGVSNTVTDDASIFEAAGNHVEIVPVTEDNRKITTPQDMEFAQWLAARRFGGDEGS